MTAPKGVRLVEYVACEFSPDTPVSNLRALLDSCILALVVNGVTFRETSIIELPMEPRMSGRFVWRLDVPVQSGDIITVELRGHENLTSETRVQLKYEVSIIDLTVVH